MFRKFGETWGTHAPAVLVELDGRGNSLRRTGEPMTLSLPPFTKAVTWLIGINTTIFLLRFALELAHLPATAFAQVYLGLTPAQVVYHGWLWQLLPMALFLSSSCTGSETCSACGCLAAPLRA